MSTILYGSLGMAIYDIYNKGFEYIELKFISLICREYYIEKGNYKILQTIRSELLKYVNPNKLRLIKSDSTGLVYDLPPGIYKINIENIASIYIHIINDDEIRIFDIPEIKFCIMSPIKYHDPEIKKLIDNVYSKYTAPTNLTMNYISNQGKWIPISRRPISFQTKNLTPEMNNTIQDLNMFVNSENNYNAKGYPYRRGYLLYGKPGTGKSTIIQIAAKEHNRSVYMINLNAKDMTDEIIINLILTVPPYSIIVFDEIDKQFDTLQSNKNNMISSGGILSAIDGPIRLSHGTIVIMTANRKKILPSFDNMNALLRPGRIDKVIEFKNEIIL